MKRPTMLYPGSLKFSSSYSTFQNSSPQVSLQRIWAVNNQILPSYFLVVDHFHISFFPLLFLAILFVYPGRDPQALFIYLCVCVWVCVCVCVFPLFHVVFYFLKLDSGSVEWDQSYWPHKSHIHLYSDIWQRSWCWISCHYIVLSISLSPARPSYFKFGLGSELFCSVWRTALDNFLYKDPIDKHWHV